MVSVLAYILYTAKELKWSAKACLTYLMPAVDGGAAFH